MQDCKIRPWYRHSEPVFVLFWDKEKKTISDKVIVNWPGVCCIRVVLASSS